MPDLGPNCLQRFSANENLKFAADNIFFGINNFYTLPHSVAHDLCKHIGPDQAKQNIEPDLDPNCFHSDGVLERIFIKKLILKKNSR